MSHAHRITNRLELIEVGQRVLDAHRQEIIGEVFSEQEGNYKPWWDSITIAPQSTLAGALLAVVDLND